MSAQFFTPTSLTVYCMMSLKVIRCAKSVAESGPQNSTANTSNPPRVSRLKRACGKVGIDT